MKNWGRNMLLVVALILVILGSMFMAMGFDKKDNYFNPTSYSSASRNVYVGGDAYNYIINSNYFTGYMTLASAFFVCGTLLFVTGLLTKLQDSGNAAEHQSKEPGEINPPATGEETSHESPPENHDLPA